ncbi:origin recognition complex subunit 4-like isoform X1 [Lytechinus variegatus]|uniref:origin recognition complex subunit 4-like isoform X1 n=2 Tax=Lytechinus TaxID=7652 RepID=UPI001BB25235|nr:origin recognition complex subunit 4-like isoform X1 [Lytechinus variegatus]XP_041458649.1 origin recognition complex subunit 4-like isoform X1 [Lytechinus variegatus]
MPSKSKSRKSISSKKSNPSTSLFGAEDEVYCEVQRILRSRVCGSELPTSLPNLQDQRKHLLNIIERCATQGESNSALVIGPRGSGKSMLLKHVLAEVMKDRKVSNNLLQVHLNGLLQTDDRIAIQEITRQLKLENVAEDKVFGSFAENLAFLLESLKKDSSGAQSILFIVDEFDLFAHHKNQTLLYNLFDVCQSAQTPITVIGVTCRLDVVELLEKRVKSRFSHRQIHVFNTLTFEQYCNVFKETLTLPSNFMDKMFAKEWNNHVKELTGDCTVTEILEKTYSLDKSIRSLYSLMLLPIARISADRPTFEGQQLLESRKLHSADSKAAMLHGVSILQLCLIIAMRHLTDLYEGDPFNFEMVYNEYQKFIQKKSHTVQQFDKSVVLKAFEHLVALELVKPAEHSTGSSTRTQKEYRAMSILVTSSQLIESLSSYPSCPSELQHWAKNPMAS